MCIDDFVPADGGEWYGLLFDNPSLDLPPRLTWCFNFPFKDVSREDDSPLSLNVEWLPVPADSWRRLTGRHLTSAHFGEPAEASIYYYLHHRFDSLDLDLVEQRGRLLRAVATVSGDIDHLGIDPVRADAWLTFTGILVSLHDAVSPDAALARLGQFTDTNGLALEPDGSDAALRFIALPD
ncbi:hypothetical protein [Plantactinospora sp. GCM10030261]|uniref:hypothetical protein n=1 Tax=Plantactinospora sp. GCM10030261 TaxID=3273420 RepID=UPI00361C8BA1